MSADLTGLRRFLAIVCLAMVAASSVFSKFEIVFSVALGGVIVAGNLFFLERFLKVALLGAPSPSAARVLTMLSFYARFAALAVALYLFVMAGWINFIALAAGLSITAGAMLSWFFILDRRSMRDGYERAY